MENNYVILNSFTRKLANSRYRVSVDEVVKCFDEGRFGYEIAKDGGSVVENGSVFADSIKTAISHIRDIFKYPHIFLKSEQVIQNVAVASHINNETLRMNYKDGKLWRRSTLNTSPEFVYSFVYEDDCAIYENCFLCYLIDMLLTLTIKEINQIKQSLTTVGSQVSEQTENLTRSKFLEYLNKGEAPALEKGDSPLMKTFKVLLKNRRQLLSLKETKIYVDCAKKGKFNIGDLKATNIFLNDDRYHYCYLFYLNYLRREINYTEESVMYQSFVTLQVVSALLKSGYESVEKQFIVASKSGRIRLDDIRLTNGVFDLTLQKEEDNCIKCVFTSLDGNSQAQYNLYVMHSSELKERQSIKGVANWHANRDKDISYKTMLITDKEENGVNLMTVLPTDTDIVDRISELFKTYTVVSEGSNVAYAKVCPICGSTALARDGYDLTCMQCSTTYYLFNDGEKDCVWFKKFPLVEKDEKSESKINVRFVKSFTAKVIQVKDQTKEYYVEIVNHLLSYKKVGMRSSWAGVAFNYGRKTIAKCNIRGTSLYLYLSLDPEQYSGRKYCAKDVSSKSKYKGVPTLIKVKSDRALKKAKELIDIIMSEFGGVKANNPQSLNIEDFATDSLENLVERGLIKDTQAQTE